MDQEPVKIAVFDLNKTVYQKSSKDEFFKYICYKKNYKLLNIFQIALFTVMGKLHLFNKTEFKENFFQYLKGIPPAKVKKYAAEFWNIEWPECFNQAMLERIEVLRKQGVQIIICTGGFDVYVGPLFEKLFKVDAWIATETTYDHETYKIKGKALKDEEKVKGLDKHFAGKPYTIVETYSDQKEVLFDIAEKSYLMKKGVPIPYNGTARQ